jgi:23S rRNA (cytidine1920-2'-O)/16S rRNA (cytidine1409-2'-O)-methyltransferase
MDKKKPMRLDQYLVQKYPQETRQRIQELIKNGSVTVNSISKTKPGILVPDDADVSIDLKPLPYVSRAGVKLAHALDHFQCNVSGLTVLDAGLSTGGFADCLLQRGAKKIFGIDVGHGQVHQRIKDDPRLVVMENTNLKDLPSLPDHIDMVTLDLSFISVLKVIDVVTALLKPGGKLIVLIKPQFESGIEDRGKKGIIKDARVHQKVIEAVTHGITTYGFECKGVIESPIVGGSGNKEFLGYFCKA